MDVSDVAPLLRHATLQQHGTACIRSRLGSNRVQRRRCTPSARPLHQDIWPTASPEAPEKSEIATQRGRKFRSSCDPPVPPEIPTCSRIEDAAESDTYLNKYYILKTVLDSTRSSFPACCAKNRLPGLREDSARTPHMHTCTATAAGR